MANIISGSLVANIQIGGRTHVNIPNLKKLYCRVAGVGSGNSTFRTGTFGTSAGYQVPTGKAFKPKFLRIIPLVASDQFSTLLYSDNDVGNASNTAFTNGQSYGGAPNIYIVTLTAPFEIAFDDNASVPASKYIGIQSTGSTLVAQLHLYGEEVTV